MSRQKVKNGPGERTATNVKTSVVDLAPLYPASIKPALIANIREWYIKTYHDRLFTHPPAWFNFYLWLEAFYHVPVSLWAVGALLRDDPRVSIALLPFAMETAVTTATCVVDMLAFNGYSRGERVALAQIYVPYLAFAVFMGVDMYGRLEKRVSAGSSSNAAKKNA